MVSFHFDTVPGKQTKRRAQKISLQIIQAGEINFWNLSAHLLLRQALQTHWKWHFQTPKYTFQHSFNNLKYLGSWVSYLVNTTSVVWIYKANEAPPCQHNQWGRMMGIVFLWQLENHPMPAFHFHPVQEVALAVSFLLFHLRAYLYYTLKAASSHGFPPKIWEL